jgi:hypothetical protein
MGLDVSHDCWHGPYSQFMRWRQWLNHFVMITRENADPRAREFRFMGATREAWEAALNGGQYDDQTVPINVLMAHSDCDGSIPAAVCGPLADALEELVRRCMPPRGTYDEMRPPTERFAAGLRRAAAAGEDVLFR